MMNTDQISYFDAPEPVHAEWEDGMYVAVSPSGHVWYSTDGDYWTDQTGEPVVSEVFYSATIVFAGGPRDAQAVS